VAAVCALAANLLHVPGMQPLTGLIVIMTIAYCCSTNRRAIDLRTVAWGLGLQIVFALIVLKTTAGRVVFQKLAAVINHLLDFAFVGSSFVFGPLGSKEAWPRIMTTVLGPEGAQYGVIFAFQVLPTIIFIAALFAILYYFGIMQIVVRAFAVMMRRVMRASGAESLNVAASIFMGQTEAPLTIRPFIPKMTESELMTIMTAGMAHISGGIMAAYILFGIKAEHLLTAGHHDGARHADDGEDVRAPRRRCPRRWGRSSSRWSAPTSTSSTRRAAARARGCSSPSTSARC
jgi:CNT family concentrative nucleoside transporter